MRNRKQPSYLGRVLPRPDEELVDQGLQFDLGTLMNRRRALTLLGLGVAGSAVAACGGGGATSSSTPTSAATADTSSTSEIPDETAGPYPGDGSNGPDVLEQSGVVRRDIRSSFGSSSGTAAGIDMTLELNLLDIAKGGGAMVGAAVYVWHCDQEGRYSMYSQGAEDQNYLRGVQISDDSGMVRFTSIFPACYDGRWPHIHFEVYPDQASITDSSKAIATSQVALPKNVCDAVYATEGYEASVSNLARVSLSTDGVFGDDGGSHQIATVTGAVTTGYTVSLAVPIDTTTTPSAGHVGGPGGLGGPPPA